VLRTIERQFDIAARPDLAPHVHWRGQSELPFHRWYRYREGFSPRLIEKLDLVGDLLDPFCGCGSIMVGAAQHGQSAFGIDINPLAVFVAQTKLRRLDRRDIATVRRFRDDVAFTLPGTTPAPLPSLRIASKVFEPEILDTLLRLRALIAAVDRERARDLIFLAWLEILESVGSYFKEGNGIKYRNKKRLRTGYVRRKDGEWQLARFGPDQRAFVLTTFLRHLDLMIDDAIARGPGTWDQQVVVEGDALETQQLVGKRTFDSVVFSPPYANRFDYFEAMKVELWFGGFVHTYDDGNALRKKSLRSHLGADLRRPTQVIPELEELLALMDVRASSWRMGVPAALRGYFDDMDRVLREVLAVLRPGGRCCVVVGNSAYAGVIIPTDALVAQLGLGAGFQEAQMLYVRHLTVAPQQRTVLSKRLLQYMRESVVVLTK
jgi:SAM-dependent methyltransferase